MSQLAEIDTEARQLLNTYRAQMVKIAQLKLANGAGHASVLRQAQHAALTASELLEEFGLDADELLEELNEGEALEGLVTYAVNSGTARDWTLALRSVREAVVLRQALGSVGNFGELPKGTRQPVSIPLYRQSALASLLERGAVEVDGTQEHRVTTLTRYHRVVLTQLGEALLERFEQ
jgi:hypothetical protein